MATSSLEIDTKYYTAKLQLFHAPPTQDQPSFTPQSESLHRNYVSQLLNRVDAVIVIHEESGIVEENMLRLQSFLEHATETLDPGVLLYVTNKEENLPWTMLEWCQENGFEVVGLENEEEDDKEVGGIKEKFGLPRIMEALECHMWTNMEYKTSLRPQREKVEEPAKPEEEEIDDLGDVPAGVRSTFADVMKFMKGEEMAAGENATEGVQMANFEGLMSAMGPIQQLRAHLSTLEDDQRRKMAARVAMALMGVLGDNDDEDDLETFH